MAVFFEVTQHKNGAYEAVCHLEGIRTEGADLEELHGNISHAVEVAFEGREKPLPSEINLIVSRE